MNGGYPDDYDIAWLKEELSSLDFHRGAEAIKFLIDSTFYGHADIEGDPVKLTVTTGGWSGCEEIMDVVFHSLWEMKYWESTHRGGKFIFSPLKAYKKGQLVGRKKDNLSGEKRTTLRGIYKKDNTRT